MSSRKKNQPEEAVSNDAVVEEVVEHPEQPAEQQAVEEEYTGQLIYCGPSLPSGLLRQHTVYRNGLPQHQKEHFEKCPALRQLFVPVERLSATMQALQIAATPESIFYTEVQKHFSGGVK